MSGNTNVGEPSTNGTATNDAASGNSDVLKIREFLYLNQDKIFSYLSQIDGGLKLLYSKVENDSWEERRGQPTKTTGVQAGVQGDAAFKLLALAEARVEANVTGSHTVESGIEERIDSGSRGSLDLFGLHHKAFDLVLEKLGGRLMTVHGQIFIIDFDWLEENLKDFPAVAKALNALSEQKMTPPKNTTQMSYLFRTYLSGKVLVILRDDDGDIYTAYLDRQHCTTSVENIFSDYGQAPSGRFTLTGISAPPQTSDAAGNFSVPHFIEGAQQMADQLATFAGAMVNMRHFLEVKSTDGHLVPLALYLELT